jgi:hypothetical protein
VHDVKGGFDRHTDGRLPCGWPTPGSSASSPQPSIPPPSRRRTLSLRQLSTGDRVSFTPAATTLPMRNARSPSVPAAEAAPVVLDPMPLTANRRGRGRPRKQAVATRARRVADPFNADDDGANRCAAAMRSSRRGSSWGGRRVQRANSLGPANSGGRLIGSAPFPSAVAAELEELYASKPPAFFHASMPPSICEAA